MNKLFISHCAKDQSEVCRLIDLLTLGMGVCKDDIFCTSINGTLPIGESFSENIRKALQESEVVLFFITQNFLESKFCLSELGAGWGNFKKLIPFIAPPTDYKALNDTPLQGVQAIRQDSRLDLIALYSMICNLLIAKTEAGESFYKQLLPYLETKDLQAG